jgi:mRNA interferase RelE/StbE
MAQYEVEFKTSAAKEFRKLAPEIKYRIREGINALKTEPRPVGVKKLVEEFSLCRIRLGDYRIIYEIDDSEQILLITRVRHRSDAYQ